MILHVGQGLTVQIKRDGLARGNRDILGHILQQGDGSIISCLDSIGEGLVIGIADLGATALVSANFSTVPSADCT